MNKLSRQNILFIAVAFALFFLLVSSKKLISVYVDWRFFGEVGYASVFTKILLTKLAAGLALGVVTALVFYANIFYANRMVFQRSSFQALWDNAPALQYVDPDKLVKQFSYGIIVFAGIVAFFSGIQYWEDILLFLNGQPAAVADPLFNKDISFYLFVYPFVDQLTSIFSVLLILSFFVTALNYFFRGGVTFIEGLINVDPRVKRHLGLLVALFLLTLSLNFFLDRYALLTNEHGVLYGASYTDVHARIFMYGVLTAVTIAAAAVFFVMIQRRSFFVPLITVGVVAGIYFLGLVLYPSLLQSFKVAPNEIVLERPYIEHHIRLTRFGYGLESMETAPFDVSEDLSFADIRKNVSTVRNIRLWDEDPLLRTYSQLQQIRTYYRFIDADNDRYTVDGTYRQVMLSPRELSYADLPGKNWINEHLVFTHGIGLAMGPVSAITQEGLPEFFIKDIPPVSASGLAVARPEIYYGERPNDYVVVRTKVKEFSYPSSGENIYTTYEGSGGLQVASLLKRLLYGIHFGNLKILLSSDITSESMILYYRNIMERVNTIAPFFAYDSDPYLVLSDSGRLFWIIDAYSHTDRLPYSKPVQRGVNYMRNPLKVVVDAYNGSVDFYVVDEEDVLARTYGAIFPKLFKPLSAMPADLRKHIRYPRTLLRIQAQMFATFHMTDPEVFYNKEDLWEIPSYKDRAMDPYYLIMKLPEGKKEEFILLLPFTPAKRDNLAAWMAAQCDGENYGKVIVYTFPRDRLVFGPRQIDARIDQDAYISQQLTLWGQRGSDVIRGSLLIIPIENSLLYVQPLFLVATERGGLPELRRVIMAFGKTVVMEETLEDAIQALFKGALPRERVADITKEVKRRLTEQEIGAQALESLRKARQALRGEDWAGFGQHLRDAEESLKGLAK